MGSFEEALHQGYSKADMAADWKEKEARTVAVGCPTCIYRERNSPVCLNVLENEDIYKECPYYKKGAANE